MGSLSLGERSVVDRLENSIWVCNSWGLKLALFACLLVSLFGFVFCVVNHVGLVWFVSGVNVQSGEEVAVKLVCWEAFILSCSF